MFSTKLFMYCNQGTDIQATISQFKIYTLASQICLKVSDGPPRPFFADPNLKLGHDGCKDS